MSQPTWPHRLVFIEDDKLWSFPQCGLELRQTDSGIEVLKPGTVPVDEHVHGGPPPPPDWIKRALEAIEPEIRRKGLWL